MDDFDTVSRRLAASLAAGSRSAADRRQIMRLLLAAADLAEGRASSLDVKIAGTAVHEMVKAFEMFAPFRDRRKVTIFGSARITSNNPIYSLTVHAARVLADHGFMAVTGAGPGLMEAGMLGAGRENSIGVSIRLPFESGANSIIAGDDKYVAMRYFFTRKLMLVKESHAFLCMPGGFGTLDETFELLTLAQTAKSVPVPIVFLEVPGDPFWSPLMGALEPLLLSHGLISATDRQLYRITDNVEEAVAHVTGFYSNYHSIRFVRNMMHIRIHRRLPEADFDAVRSTCGAIAAGGVMTQAGASPEEMADGDVPDLHRVVLDYTGKGFADLLPLIDALNKY